ncbi:hypothetical protein CJP72_23370 [Citrobacter sp. NCU1]|uniref:carboxymuconolactone decarboxylase family protein n=1 Tax=Citrobacter sp. NCU1 TaxID=2026683 RepID=UPI001390B1EC|nr:carboxymuconolactone decarboxylase family protein [Citrobacter sp. NCU1]NDO83584.1 hypothetical protein [Citrobacter sp. NCU1]
MEQRRIEGKGHWYHETQSNAWAQDVLPLVPEAAHVEDRFLLDLPISEDALFPFQSWLHPARQLAHILFPIHAHQNQMNTFSDYERMSTALTVAQVCGVQRLCNHYAARLAPLPGPDSSRESNHRLAQITQYARQLASSPAVIDARARQHLDDVGLTAWDSVLLNQIVGFVGFQARVVAVFQAFLGQPVRWVPGLDMQPFAPALPFAASEATWHPAHVAVALRQACDGQQASLSRHQPVAELQRLSPVLAHEPDLLSRLSTLMTSSLRTEVPKNAFAFATLLTARINGSVACFNEQAQRSVECAPFIATLRQDEREIQQWERRHPVERITLQAIQWLTRAPNRFSDAQFNALSGHDFSSEQAINLLSWCGLCGWLNRLKIALGETH